MNINFDKFWEFLRQWSVGKIVVTLSLLVILIKSGDYPTSINYFIAIGVFHELFDFCNNNLTDKSKKDVGKTQIVVFNLFMLISLISIIGIVLKLLWK